jgi:hypothetical protein
LVVQQQGVDMSDGTRLRFDGRKGNRRYFDQHGGESCCFFIDGNGRLPDVGTPEEERLFRAVRRVDPRITRERFDAYIAGRRAQTGGSADADLLRG